MLMGQGRRKQKRCFMKKSVKHAIVITAVAILALLWHSMVRPWEWWQKLQKTGPLWSAEQKIEDMLWSAEQSMEDILYRRPVGTSKNIKIIGVDEETLNTYGKFEDCSREKLADLIELLSAEEE
jgi:CHASE2 domain-containing sensor protein